MGERSHETRTIIYRSSLSNRGRREPNLPRQKRRTEGRIIRCAISRRSCRFEETRLGAHFGVSLLLGTRGRRERRNEDRREYSAKRVEGFSLPFALRSRKLDGNLMLQVKLRNDGAAVEVDGSSPKVSSFRERDPRVKGMEEPEFKEKRDSVVGADFQAEFSFLEAKGSRAAGWGSCAKLRGEVLGPQDGRTLRRGQNAARRRAALPGFRFLITAAKRARRFAGKSLRRDRGDSTIGWTVL